MLLSRRKFNCLMFGVAAGTLPLPLQAATALSSKEQHMTPPRFDLTDAQWKELSKADWKARLTNEQFDVLRNEGTERAGSSPLNEEKREGIFACAGCQLPLFKSNTKYESGTGWPSFFDAIEGAVATKTDYKLLFPRTEYHCARCGGHQGHIFTDGPKPTGKRYCNNGVALTFIPDESAS